MMKRFSYRNRWCAAALIWGSLWGAAEATVGHVLHLVKIPGLPGMVMFPLGVFFMLKAFQAAGKIKVIWLTALTASAFKMADLAVSSSFPEAALNPAAAILFEALIVIAVLAAVKLVPASFDIPVLTGFRREKPVRRNT
jgi:hypothetical protein